MNKISHTDDYYASLKPKTETAPSLQQTTANSVIAKLENIVPMTEGVNMEQNLFLASIVN